MANKYDRIIKENFGEPTLWILSKVLGVKAIDTPLLPKLQHTVEREVDMLLLIKIEGEEPYIAIIEWQSSNDPNMGAAMLHSSKSFN